MTPLSLEVLLNGAASGETFLIVSTPDQPLPATLSLRTTDGSERDIQCRPAQASATALALDPATVHVTGTPVAVEVITTSPSATPNDTTIEIVHEGMVVARFDLTTITMPRVRFSGRFQCRLATNQDPFPHPWGTLASSFRMYAVQGPNALDPAVPPDEPSLDRIIRFQDGVPPRPRCGSIGVNVTAIEAEVGGERLQFKVGDPLLGLPVRLGTQSRFEEQDGSFSVPTLQPIADFRLELGTLFAGASEPAAPRLNPNPSVPPPTRAPYADGAFPLDVVGPWNPADFGHPERTWAEHAQTVLNEKLAGLLTDTPADEQAARIRQRRIDEHQAFRDRMILPLTSVQRFSGEIDRELQLPDQPTGVLAYLATLPSIPFFAEFFDFDTDCHIGAVTGTLGVRTSVEAAPAVGRLTPAVARGSESQPP